MGQEKEKNKAEIWIGVANLIVTMIVGAGVAIFLNYRNEQIQKELPSLQAEVERQSNLAHLEISSDCQYSTINCGSFFEIRNTGPAAAKNISTVIMIESFDVSWSGILHDVDQFKLSSFPPSIDIDRELTRIDSFFGAKDFTGKNAIKLSVDTLPAGTRFQVLLALSPTLQTKTYDFEGNVVFVNATEFVSELEKPLKQHFEISHTVASFNVTSNCDNCEGVLAPASLIVSGLIDWGYDVMGAQETEDGINLESHLTMKYVLPADVIHTSTMTGTLGFLVDEDTLGQPHIVPFRTVYFPLMSHE